MQRISRHPEEVPLLITQEHGPDASLAVGANGTAPVLMYAPAVNRLLARSHPGSVALEMMMHPSADASWLCTYAASCRCLQTT